jgi:putative redox protein
MKCEIEWTEGFHFQTHVREHSLVQDASKLSGGTDQGPTPKELLLASICGCTGMDVVGFLRKSKTVLNSLSISAQAEQTATHPKIFSKVHLQFRASGPDAAIAPLVEAVEKSQTMYCGVSAMIARTCAITYEVLLNERVVANGQAKFA